MDSDKEKNSRNEYERRYADWRNISITQLSNVNNILLTLSSSFIVFIFDKNPPSGSFYFSLKNIDWPKTIYFFAIIFLLLSIKSGVIVLFSRLYDMKFSRNIALTRKRFLLKYNGYLKSQKERVNPNFFKEIDVIILALCEKIRVVDSHDIDTLSQKQLEDKFYDLSRKTKLLGLTSWRWLKYQILFFTLNCVLYAFYRFVA
ncbi:hypothetical protein [Spirosoma utsteinense]|uniref:hypothetical protein n=1 Tax=Spirosoma utsteinense TaxID=2585773 RepID=UPI0016494F27|nr:hypothetical protein [Spirosoma utsteinense]MBC3789001.1 hypothetical protein [Spirosoma utsteinense]